MKRIYCIVCILWISNSLYSQNLIKFRELDKTYTFTHSKIHQRKNHVLNYKMEQFWTKIDEIDYQGIVLNLRKEEDDDGYLRIKSDSVFFLYKNYNKYISNDCEENFSYHKENFLFGLNTANKTANNTYIIDIFNNRICNLSTNFYSPELGDTVNMYSIVVTEDPCLWSTVEDRYLLQIFWFSRIHGFMGFFIKDLFNDSSLLISNKHYLPFLIEDIE